MSFAIYEKTVIMCSGDNLLHYDFDTGEEKEISLPKLQSADPTTHNNVDIDAYHGITAVFFSPDGKYFSACTNRKQLCLYEKSDCSLVSNRTLARAASKARFTPHNDIVVADKSGDAYVFSTARPQEAGQLALGHLSMLLDVLVTRDNSRVVTADRDEKIRVSAFPNSYNIVSYCLGHRKFVTSVEQHPRDDGVLASAGGDGELKFWDYERGQELSSVCLAERIPGDELERLNDSLKCFELTEPVETLPAKHLRLVAIGERSILATISFFSSRRILVYEIGKDLRAEYVETLTMEEEPLECILRDSELWILEESGLRVFNYEEKKFQVDAERNKRLEGLNRLWRKLRSDLGRRSSLFPILYKRKYDNVQEYQERKKSRLGNS